MENITIRLPRTDNYLNLLNGLKKYYKVNDWKRAVSKLLLNFEQLTIDFRQLKIENIKLKNEKELLKEMLKENFNGKKV